MDASVASAVAASFDPFEVVELDFVLPDSVVPLVE